MKKNYIITIVIILVLGLMWGAVNLQKRGAENSSTPLAGDVLRPGGHITSVSSGTLYLESTAGAEPSILGTSSELKLSDTIIVGQGVVATIKLVKPAEVPEGSDLIFIKPKDGEVYPIDMTIEQKSDGVIEVNIRS